MSSFGRKIARQSKHNTPEGKEQLKQEQADKKAAAPLNNQPLQNQQVAGHQPATRIRQRRAGNS